MPKKYRRMDQRALIPVLSLDRKRDNSLEEMRLLAERIEEERIMRAAHRIVPFRRPASRATIPRTPDVPGEGSAHGQSSGLEVG